MTRDRVVVRKIVYFVAIAVLLFPLVLIGRPASTDSPGGKLADLRASHKLGQSQFGEIDPASEKIRQEIDQTKRACNAEKLLGSQPNC